MPSSRDSSGSQNSGAFVPSTQVWDVSEVYSTDVNSAQFKELIVRLYQNMNTNSTAVNARDSGIYDTEEFVNGQSYFAATAISSRTNSTSVRRQVFRKVVNFGALPNNTTKSVAHGITVTAGVTFTRIYGSATQPSTKFLPIPYSSATAADIIELYVDGTNVSIKTGKDMTAFTACYVVLEYLKQ